MRSRAFFFAASFALVAAAVVAGCGEETKVAEIAAPPVLVAPVESLRIEDRI